jgi:hypothetical protein
MRIEGEPVTGRIVAMGVLIALIAWAFIVLFLTALPTQY